MNKKLFFLLILMVIAAFMPTVAKETLTVHDGNYTSNYVPAYVFYWDDFTRCQSVFPAEELAAMNGYRISELTFYSSMTSAYTSESTAVVYLTEVDYTSISGYAPVSNVVYTGTITVDATGVLNIEFDNPYTYGGGNLLIGIDNTTDANYKNIYFYGETVEGASISGSNANDASSAPATQRNFLPKTTFTYIPADAVIYDKPTNLQVSDIETNSAKVTWTPGGTETAWNVEYKKAADEEWTSAGAVNEPTITLDALENGVEYEVRVQGDYGDGQSGWVSTSFTTLRCEISEMGYITYTLGDSYGDGWGYNRILVLDAETNVVIQTISLSSGSSGSGSIDICLGETYKFNWVSGSYPEECSFTITDPYGEVIVQHDAGTAPTTGELASYTFESLNNPKPKNFAINEVAQTTAVATWEGQAEAYNLRYRIKGDIEKFYEENFENGIGGWTVRKDGDGNPWELIKITEYAMGGIPLTDANGGEYALASCSVDLSVGNINCDNWAISPQLDFKGTLNFFVADLGPSYIEHFSVYVSTTGTDVADFIPLEENIATPGTLNIWAEHSYDLSAYEGEQGYIAIRHQGNGISGYYMFLDAVSLNGAEIPAGEWVVVENTTSPTTLEGLVPETEYEAQVQAVYAEENSDWTELVDFKTLAMTVVPVDLEVTEVTATTATAEWEGVQDSYNLRYRVTAPPLNQINEDFETMTTGSNPPEGWTMIDADGDGNCWYGWAPSTINDDEGNPTVLGNAAITSASFASVGALTPDNWLITPKVNLGGTVSLMYRGQDPAWAAEHFGVYVSVAGNTDPADFVAVSEEIVADTIYYELTVDLSEYEGQVGYIAIRHFDCTNMFRLNIDNFVYNNNEKPNGRPGRWTVIENVTSPTTIEGLDPETEYEVEVQGIYGEATTDWTAPVKFTTLEEEKTSMDEFYMVGTFNDWNQDEDGGRIAFEEADGVFTATVTLDAEAEFKIITPTEDGGWKWFGGQDDNHVGYFLINADLLNVNITLVEGSNFRVEEAGSYTLQLMEQPSADGLKGIYEPLVMKVVKNEDTGIASINVDKNSKDWYNLNGQKLNGKPTVPGIYINGNKKVVIK